MKYSNFKRILLGTTSFLLASTISLGYSPKFAEIQLHWDVAADARSSGGRAGGGSFRSSSPSRSSSSPSRSSGSSRSSSPSRPSYNRPSSSTPRTPVYRDRPGSVIVPVPVGPRTYSTPYNSNPTNTVPNSTSSNRENGDSTWVLWFLGFAVVGAFIFVFLLLYVINRFNRSVNNEINGFNAAGELTNNTVTVSKVQVALLAQAHEVQTALTNLSEEVETSTAEGLYQLLQESVLILLRNPENWSHVLANSETVKSLERGEALFNEVSIAERSKFSVETLTNVGGRVRKRDFQPDPDEDPAAYIVVTLLVGTAHDQPLFSEIRTADTLKEVLQKLAAIPPDYLMVFELLWSPQDPSDSLTYDELLSEYTTMLQI